MTERKTQEEVIAALQSSYRENAAAMAEIQKEMIWIEDLPKNALNDARLKRLSDAEDALRQARNHAMRCLQSIRA